MRERVYTENDYLMADDFIKSEKERASIEADFIEWKRKEIDREIKICLDRIKKINDFTFMQFCEGEIV